MEGLARTAGQLFRTMKIGDTTYRLASPRLSDLASLEAELLSRLPDPIEQAAKAVAHLPPECHPALWDRAFAEARESRRITGDDSYPMPVAIEAAAAAYLALRRHHGDEIRTLDDAIQWMDRAIEAGHSFEDIRAVVKASEEVAAKNSEDPAAD